MNTTEAESIIKWGFRASYLLVLLYIYSKMTKIEREHQKLTEVEKEKEKPKEKPKEGNEKVMLSRVSSMQDMLLRQHIRGEAEVVRLMLPDDANPAGNVHGGTILKMIEQVGWIVAARHCVSSHEKEEHVIPATVRIEKMDFHLPVFIGEVVTLRAKLVYTSNQTMQVIVYVSAENLESKTKRHTNTAVLWYASVVRDKDGNMKPRPVPPFIPQGEEEKRAFDEAHQVYLQRKKKITEDESKPFPPISPEELKSIQNLEDKDALSINHSATQLTQLMLPSDCVQGGIVQGGVIMKLMDNAAGCVAARHCGTNVVTVCVEAMDFKAPVFNGNLISVVARIVFMSQKSMEIEVIVEAEGVLGGVIKKFTAITSLFKFVSLDKSGKSQVLKKVKLENEREIDRFRRGLVRYEEDRKRRAEKQSQQNK